MRVFLFALLLLPLLELALLVAIGREIGVLLTLLWMFIDVLAGIFLMRNVGPATALRMRERLMQGDVPGQEMLDGLLMGLAGLLLIFPGVLSDFAAILCLLPMSRYWVRDLLGRQVQRRAPAAHAEFQHSQHGQSSHYTPPKTHAPDIIEGEWERKRE